MPASKSVCIAALKSVAEQYLDPAEVDNFILDHEAKVKEIMALDTLKNQWEAEAEAAKEMIDSMKAQALLNKKNAAEQTLKTIRIINNIKQIYPQKEYNNAIKHLLGGTAGKFRKGASDSVAKRMDSNSAVAMASYLSELDKKGLAKFYADDNNARAIIIELAEIKEGGHPGASGSEAAQQVAEILHKHQEYWRLENNRYGANIEALPGYSIMQTHDPAKLSPHKGETVDQAFKRWKDFIKPKLDWGRTFRGQKDTDKILRGIWDGLQTEQHLTYGEDGVAINSGGNRAQRVSNSRKLHFKDGASFYEYNKVYGTGDLVWNYNAGITSLARNAALINMLGVNPKKTIDDIYKVLKITTARTKDLEARGSMASGDMDYHWDPQVRNLYLEVIGKTKVPANNTLAQLAQNTRMWVSMARLGMSTISSYSDIATQLSQASFMGLSKSETFMNAIKMLTDFSRKSLSAEERQVLSSFGIVTEALNNSLHEHINSDSLGNGMMTKGMNLFFKFCGLDWWSSSLKKGMALSITHDLGEFLARGSEFGEFRYTMQSLLESYNLGKNEIELLKKMPLVNYEGKHFIDAGYVHQIADNDIIDYINAAKRAELQGNIDAAKGPHAINAAKKLLRDYKPLTAENPRTKDLIFKTKQELEQRLRSFVYDRTSASVLEPDAVTRAWLNQGTQAGTLSGEGLRMITQFKGFMITMYSKAISPWMYNANNMDKAVGLTELFLTSTALGYLSMVTKDALRGKKPQPFSADAVIRAALQGGAMGLLGDILFGDAQGNVSLAALFEGPTLSSADDIYNIYLKARSGDDAASEFLKRARNFVPGQNLWFTKLPIDYLLMYGLQEKANPGYLDRLQRNLYNKTGQEYWLDPGTFVR